MPLKPILSRPADALRGDNRNIAVLARAYHGVALDAVWNVEGGFAKTEDQ